MTQLVAKPKSKIDGQPGLCILEKGNSIGERVPNTLGYRADVAGAQAVVDSML